MGGSVGAERFPADSAFLMIYHTPVLLKEVVEQLRPRSGGVFVDGTVGGGGHAAELLRASVPEGRLIGLDWDEDALVESCGRLREFGERAQLMRANYAEWDSVLVKAGITAVDGALLDLGVSSRQFDAPSRGFSFQREGPLDMRMDQRSSRSARDLLLTASVEELIRIFRVYGEERRAGVIARAIVRRREQQPIETTTELAGLVERAVGGRRGRIHPATRVFQALRIAVNDELGNLQRGLEAIVRSLRHGGRMAVISFHSLEDRMVKWFFIEQSRCETPRLRVITRKPVMASDEEIHGNPRARSAKLRVAERI